MRNKKKCEPKTVFAFHTVTFSLSVLSRVCVCVSYILFHWMKCQGEKHTTLITDSFCRDTTKWMIYIARSQ